MPDERGQHRGGGKSDLIGEDGEDAHQRDLGPAQMRLSLHDVRRPHDAGIEVHRVGPPDALLGVRFLFLN